jgi:hypothetical protein
LQVESVLRTENYLQAEMGATERVLNRIVTRPRYR